MGLFGGGKVQKLNLPAAPQYLSADQLMQYGINFGKTETPLAYGARESALGDIATPESAMDYYSGYQPTSFEQGISDTYFQNALEQANRMAGQRASMSGIETQYPDIFARAVGPTIYDIGTYLANQGNTRATNSLTARLGIDPIASIVNPIYGNYQQQDQLQKESDYNSALAQALADYQYAQQKQAQKDAGIGTLGSILGGGAGFILSGGNPGGAALGASLGGTAGNALFGNPSASPALSLQDALAMYQAFPSSKTLSSSVKNSNIYPNTSGGFQNAPHQTTLPVWGRG